jgi:hypothetical protein
MSQIRTAGIYHTRAGRTRRGSQPSMGTALTLLPQSCPFLPPALRRRALVSIFISACSQRVCQVLCIVLIQYKEILHAAHSPFSHSRRRPVCASYSSEQ